MEPFDWVSVGSISKFNKAILDLKKEGKEITEESIKALYLKKGGLIIGDPSTQKGVAEGEVAFATLPDSEREAIVAEEKKKKAKK